MASLIDHTEPQTKKDKRRKNNKLRQRHRATHELLRFAKLRSGIFEPPFWGLRET